MSRSARTAGRPPSALAVLVAAVAATSAFVTVPAGDAAGAEATAPAAAGEGPGDVELRDSVTPLVPQVRALVADGSIVELVRRTGRSGEVAADVAFDFRRATVRPAGRRALVRLAGQVSGSAGTLRIVGHTDGVGGAAGNRRLSRRRAAAVAAVVRRAVPRDVRLVATGRGEAEPLLPETTAAGDDLPGARARNRRVQLRFVAR